MFDKLKRLGTETAIYGISTIVGRFLTFLLVPFYTNVLPSTSDYGIVATVYAYIAFLNVIYGYGMESAYFRYASALEIGNAKQNFSTPFLSIFITSLVFSTVLHLLSAPVASLMGIGLRLCQSGALCRVDPVLRCDLPYTVCFATPSESRKALREHQNP